jgi:phenylacetaldehyde dehydrogenase
MAVADTVERQADAFVHASHKLLIDGQWVPAASGETFETINPATEETLASVAHGKEEDINRAVKAARRAFADDSPWRRMNASDRGRLIWRIADLIEDNADELAMLESLDNGKPFGVARAADVPLAADLFRYMAGWPTKIEGTVVPISALPAPGEYLAYTLREPVGVVGQIIPWNFPLLMAAWKLGPVLACGCTVVLKPAEQTPLSALRLGEIMQEAGLPDGVVNIVTGFGDAGAALAAHDDVDKVAFTGSTEVGKLIVKAAAGNLKKVTLELGGKSPNVVYADADLDVAIAGAANGIFFNHGQCCNAGSRLYVQKEIFDDVVAGVSEAAESIKVAPGTDPESQMGPLISDEQFEKEPGRRGRRRRRSRRGPWLLRAADDPHQHEQRHEGRPRGDLRPGGVCDPVRFPRRDRPGRQRHQLRPRRRCVHPRPLQGAPDRQAVARRHGLDQHLPRVRRRDAVRRLQGIGLGPRDGLPGP